MAQRSRQKMQQILEAKRASEANRPYIGDHVQPLLSVPEGAKILGVSVPTLRQWLSQRRIAMIKVGRLTKLTMKDILEFIERNRKEAVRFDGERP
jgi:excisionase family DNA binding protein